MQRSYFTEKGVDRVLGHPEPGGDMARIPDTEIERLKQDISLVRLAERQGITLKKSP